MAYGCAEPGCWGLGEPFLVDCGGDWTWFRTCPCGQADIEWPARPDEIPGGRYDGPHNWEDIHDHAR